MSLFKKKTISKSLSTSANYKKSSSENADLSVKILGSGCAKCNALEAAAAKALSILGYDNQIEHITDYSQIASYGVMSTPALVANGTVISCGRVLTSDEIVELLKVAGL